MTSLEMQREALERARSGQALSNLPTIYHEFIERGIAETDIRPRENVFTFNAWRALGRHVRKGEHGVRIVTWISIPAQINAEGVTERAAGRRPKAAVVFHVSQTDADATEVRT